MAKQQRNNRFSGMTQALKGEVLPEQELATVETQAPVAPPLPEPAPRRTRPQGKRSDPSYLQVGAYIPKTLNKQVKRKLLDTDQDFSDLVTQLLTQWVQDDSNV